jgi:hypothetical protein
MGLHPKGISCGAPADFANLAASNFWHISSPKITQLLVKRMTKHGTSHFQYIEQ